MKHVIFTEEADRDRVIYEVTDELIRIIAIAHTRRDPERGLDRLGEPPALAGQPPELTAKLIADWVHGQLHGPDTMAVADLVYHALKKLHLLAEFDLVAHEPLMRFLQSLARILVQLCPEEERDMLRLKVRYQQLYWREPSYLSLKILYMEAPLRYKILVSR